MISTTISRIFTLFFLLLFIFLIGFAQDQSIRNVDLKIAFDEEFRSRNGWRLEIKRLIRDSSVDFEKRFGLRFRIKSYEPWFSDYTRKSLFGLLNDLRKKVPQKDCDVVLGFTSQQRLEYDLSGIASYLHGYVLIRRLPSESAMKTLLKHELGHLFGAIDLEEKSSIQSLIP